MDRVGSLDALRGVAILAVFTQHLGDRFLPFVQAELARALPPALSPWVLTVIHHAHWGVDLFFVLSGSSLALGYLRALDAGRPAQAASSFWLRRAARIAPAYLVALALVLATHPGLGRAPDFGRALATNLLLLQGFWPPGGLVFIGASWSLTTEACFYLLMPFVAGPLLSRRAGGHRGWILAAALCGGAWITRAALHRALLTPGVHDALLEASQRRWIPSRLDQFVLGVIVAAVSADLARSRHAALLARLAPAAMVVAAAALVVGFRLEGALYLEPGGSWPYALISLSTAALVLAARLGEPAWRGRWAAPLRWLGLWSYGVFLHHQLCLGVAGALVSGESTWWRLGAVAGGALGLAALAGWASYRWIEQPAARRAGRGPRAGVL